MPARSPGLPGGDGDDNRWRIHKEWGLYGAPWFLALDREGIVRFAGVRGPELDLAVDTLLKQSQDAGKGAVGSISRT